MKKEIETILNLAYIYMNYGKTKRAIDYLLVASSLEPHNVQVKKMKIAAFKEIGAYSQALDIVKDLEADASLGKNDAVTLKLMKSLCLKGMDNLTEAKAVFADYIRERKDLANREYLEKHRKKLQVLSEEQKYNEDAYSTGDIDTNQEMYEFIRKNQIN